MADHDVHWRRIQTHLEKWAAELDKAKAATEKEVAKVQAQYYERLADVRDEIERSLRRWDAELKALKGRAEPAQVEAARGIEEFRQRIHAELTDWQPELDRLKSTASKTRDEARRLAQELRGKLATSRFKRLPRTAVESWGEIKPALEQAWADLRPALRSAAAKFKETPAARPDERKNPPGQPG